MPYVPPEVKERIKREVSIQRLAEARGIKLRRVGRSLMGLCPFHKDTKPSLSIDPVKNEWHCFGCDRKGDVIEWVRCAEGVSFTHAVELLKRDYLPSVVSAGPPPKISTVPKLPLLVEHTADDKKLLEIVVQRYHETLKQSPEAQRYLLKRGLQSAEMVERFRLGFANRTLSYHLQKSNRKTGFEQRGRLKELGVLRNQTPGHEHFNGSLVIPIFNLDGDVAQMYGRKINDNLRAGTEYHLYLPGPLRGVWNEEALIASKEIILCEALIDALTFWCAGYRNVTTSYGVNGFTEEIKAAFRKHGTKRIYLAYDRDPAGENAAAKHAEELMQMGIECFRVQFPKGMDANEFALKNQPAAKFFGVYLNRAAWLGKGERPAVAVIEPGKIEAVHVEPVKIEPLPEPAAPVVDERPEENHAEKTNSTAKEENALALPPVTKEPEKVFSLAVEPEAESTEAAAPNPPTPAASEVWPLIAAPVEIHGDEVVIHQGDRRYRVRQLEKNLSERALRVNLLVSRKNGRGETAFHVDTFDLSSARLRVVFCKQASEELGVKEDVIRHDLGQVFLQLEALRDEQIKRVLQPKEPEPAMNEEDRAAAMELLRDPRLLERVLEDFEKCGVVGEETNKRIAYLAAVSRLLEKPLAIVVQSASSAGKTSLMDAVLDFIPEEQRESYTAMTGQALFYMGQKNLKHKILAISEQQGADRASYPLKLLQSEGALKIASTGKDPVSGKHVTHEYTVEGPVMLFLTTTAQDPDEELMNRSIALTVNEDREQTRAIHQRQREARTIEGHLLRRKRAQMVRLHRNAQRLLRPIAVVNNHDVGEFPDYMTRARRDHDKLLTLIEAIALLHQHQREIKRIPFDENETLEYIEATEADVRLAQTLADQVGLKPSLDELRPQARKLLALITEMVKAECERSEIETQKYRFTRRTVREYTRWGDTQLRQHLHRLEEMEYLIVRRGGNQGQLVVYQLATPEEPEEQETHRRDNFAGSESNFAGASRPLRGPEKNDASRTLETVSASTSRLRGNAYRGSRENPAVDAAAVSVAIAAKPNGKAKPNGHGLAQRAGGIE